jgi:hypothetical protein
MTTIFNIESAKIDLECTEGDSIQMNFQVTGLILSTGIKIYVEAFNIPDLGTPIYLVDLEMTVRREDGKVLKSWTSIGSPSEITINPSVDGEFDLVDIDGFSESGFFSYDLQSHDMGVGGYTGTLMSGTLRVKKQVTP